MNVFTPERVTLDLSRDQFDELLRLLAYATGAAAQVAHAQRTAFSWKRCIDVVNALNEGNPDFTPYAVEEEKT